MDFVTVAKEEQIAVLTLGRDKVNPINQAVIDELSVAFGDLENDNDVRAILFTGAGKFFSFGLDVPTLISYEKDQLAAYLRTFTALYTRIFTLAKPVIVALNGHAIGGGCMLAITGDYRLMTTGKAKIALNEITFGSSVWAGSVEMLKACAGQRNAEFILTSGAMYSAERAWQLGLVDQVCPDDKLAEDARNIARGYAQKDPAAFRSIKKLLRGPLAEQMIAREPESIKEFVEIWYSETTWKQVQNIKIHD